MTRYRNSLDKIIENYIAAMVPNSFSYEGRTIEAKPLRVSPGIFSGYTCPAGCGACCPRFSLEYLPSEALPRWSDGFEEYETTIDGRSVKFVHDTQIDHADHFCRYLVKKTGRCGTHDRRPMHCDFELLRVSRFDDHYELNQRLYGRAWNMLKIDAERGAQCEMLNFTEQWRQDILRRLLRLESWIEHIGFKEHRVSSVLKYVRTGPHSKPLWIGKEATLWQ